MAHCAQSPSFILHQVTCQFATGDTLFGPLSLSLERSHCGLVGRNGVGKSRLLRLLAGVDEPSTGHIECFASRAYVAQQHAASEETTLAELLGYGAVFAALQRLEQGQPYDDDIESLDGFWDLPDRLRIAFQDAELGEFNPLSLAGSLSGGERVKALLCAAFTSGANFLLLDEPTNNLDIDTIRWLEQTLNERDSTMIIISHDRHFLNMVCTHMADLDYGELRVYAGNYDEYMTAATQARERLLADNAKKKAQIADLQSFVSRFSANASKSRQATSRARQIDKIKLDEVKASSRQNPFIRFEQDKKLFRNALEVEALTKGFDEGPLFKNFNLLLEVGEKIAILGANGVGKSTMLKTLVGELTPDSGTVKWSENASIGYYAQDHAEDFDNDLSVFDWMSQWKQEGDDEQVVRGFLGRLLFSQDDIKKPAKVLSGGEKGRMLFGKLMMQKPNILVMDEPTNHLDMESIESLNMALEMYQGTLIFVSHDREFVSSLATRVIEITPERVVDFSGNYEDYLRSKGIDG